MKGKKSYREAFLDNLKFRVRKVDERSVLVMSRFGKYRETLHVDLHFTVPLLDRVVRTVSLEEQKFTITNYVVCSCEDRFLRKASRYDFFPFINIKISNPLF